MKHSQIIKAEELLFEACMKLGASKDFTNELIDEYIYDMEGDFRNWITVNDIEYTGHIFQIAFKDNQLSEALLDGVDYLYKRVYILYLFVNNDMVKLVASESDYYQSINSNAVKIINYPDKFVTVEDLDWADIANFE